MQLISRERYLFQVGEGVDNRSLPPSGGEGGVSMQLCDPKTSLYTVIKLLSFGHAIAQ